MIKNIFKV